MRDIGHGKRDVRYVLTDEGREAMDMADVCPCQYVREGNALVCQKCDTVYGKVSVSGWAPNSYGRAPR